MAYMAHIINCGTKEANNHKKVNLLRLNQQVERGYLVEVTVSHQLMLVLQSVLEQGPYDWLQLSVRGQQIRAEHFQPGVGQPVHCRGGMSGSSVFICQSKELNAQALKGNILGILHFL